MEWLWAAFGAVWTYLIGGLGLWSWRAPERWSKQGFVNNGLRTKIFISDNPSNFRWVNFGMKAFAVCMSAMAIAGGIVTLGWIWKAL